MNRDVWSVLVTEYPEGSHTEEGHPVLGWEPDGWQDVLDSVDEYSHPSLRDTVKDGGTFFWPRAERVYLSRSTATRRAKLLRSYGATAYVMRGRVEWEETRS